MRKNPARKARRRLRKAVAHSDEMMQKIERACEVTRGGGGGLNDFFENCAKPL